MAGALDERRIVTALFADVVGSTALSERLDAEEARLVIGDAISRASQAVETYGGTINKLLGDGLLALFGAPVAHEDDPERAVRAALDIMAMASAYAEDVRRAWGVEGFAMRIGIHTGEVIVGQLEAGSYTEYGVTGDTINTAARLEAAAANDGILASDATHRLVESRFDWSNPRTLNVKGKAQPVIAFAVTGLSGAPRVDQAAAPMVGREAEFGTAVKLLERLAAGQGAVLFVVGEPGIGKTRLASELRDRAVNSSGYTWLDGRCVSYGESLPYWPYRDLLRNWLAVSPTEPELRVRVRLRRKIEELLPGKVAETYPYLATVLGLNLEPEAAAQLKPLSPESLQFRTFEVFTDLLERIARNRPVVVALDDLHWADGTSLALTERLLELAERAPLLVSISQRPETEHGSWLLKEKAEREYRHLVRELALQPLGHDSEGELLRSLGNGRSLPPALKDQLIDYSAGNPFYLEQLLRGLIDSGTLVPQNSHWALKDGQALAIPPTLEGVIIARIDRLEASWRDTLTSASVLGRTFGLELIQAVTARELADVRRAVHHLLRLDLLREEAGGQRPVYRFKHALIQETAYNTLVGPRRAQLHRRAAEWYETYYQDRLERVYGLIAHHWLGSDDREKAARYLKLAGDRALAEWALDEAVGHFRSLVPLLQAAGRKQEAAETLLQLGSTLHLAMRYREANDTWRQAFETWAPSPRRGEPARAGLRIAINVIPTDPNPEHAIHMSNMQLQDQLFERLVEVRPGPYVVPNQARRWNVSDDGLRYRMELDPEARGNDGRPIRANDVVENFRTILDPATGSTEASRLLPLENAKAYMLGEIESFERVGVRALDERTVELRLSSPAPFWMFSLLDPGLAGRAGHGNGPFRVARLDPDRVTVAADPGYRRGLRGNVAAIDWVSSRGLDPLQQLLPGSVDVVSPAWLTDPIMETVNSGRLLAAVGPPVGTTYVHFSGAPQNRTDIHLRRALAYATDRRLLAPYLPATSIVATGGLVPPGLPGHTPDSALPFNPELARESFARTNHVGALRLVMTGNWPKPFWEPLIDTWRSVLGVRVEVVLRDTFTGAPWAELAHIALDPWLADYPDPECFLHLLLHSQSTSNDGTLSSPELDRLIDRALAEHSSAARLSLFHEADRLAVQVDCSVIPLYYMQFVALHQPWVHGWWNWSFPWQTFDEITIDERSPRANGLDTYNPPG